jgi:hypothetical protein
LEKERSDICLHLLDFTLDVTTDMSDGFEPLYLGKADIEKGSRAKAIGKIEFSSIYSREKTICVQQADSSTGRETSLPTQKRFQAPFLETLNMPKY